MFKFLNSRVFRQGSVATGITVAVIALIIVFNMVVTALSQKYPLSLDLTENNFFGISDQSKEFLSGLNKDVEVFVLDTELNFTSSGEYFVQANEVIKKYAAGSPHIKVSYIDLVRSPNFSARFPDLQLNTSSILVTCGSKTAELTPYDLYDIQQDYYGNQVITASKAEQAMTSALLKVTSDKAITVSMLTGHGETPLLGLRSLLEMNNYVVIEQNLLTEEIDPEAKIAILAGPVRDLSEDELKKLDKFLDNGARLGKTLFYSAIDSQPEMPSLSAFLADWGIAVGGGVVYELSSSRTFGNSLVPMVDYAEDVYAKTVLERGLPTLTPYAKPITKLFDTKGSIKVEAPLMFSQTCGIAPPDVPENWMPTIDDVSGPFPALIVSSKTAYEGMTPQTSNVAVCSSVLAFEDNLLAATSIGNGEYFLSLLNTLSEREDVISIQSKTVGAGELGISAEQVNTLAVMLTLVLPLAVLITGIAIWLRRRHL